METSSWGILFENNSLLAELFLRDHLNKAGVQWYFVSKNNCTVFIQDSYLPYSDYFTEFGYGMDSFQGMF